MGLVVLLGLSVVWAGVARPALACSCVAMQGDAELAERAQAVFTGLLIERVGTAAAITAVGCLLWRRLPLRRHGDQPG